MARQRDEKVRRGLLCCIAGVLLCLFLAVNFGATETHLFDLFSGDATANQLLELRLLRALCAAVVGALLGFSGAVLQRLLSNPLADPFVLGISSGGTAAAVAASLYGVPAAIGFFDTRTVFALIGCAATLILLLGAKAFSRGFEQSYFIAVVGLILNSFFGAAILILFALKGQGGSAEAYKWLIGSVADSSWTQLAFISVLSIVAFAFLLKLSRSITALCFGDELARSLGFDSKGVFNQSLFWTAILVACSVTLAGSVGFVGLIVPHLAMRFSARKPFSEQWLISASLGAMALLLGDLCARALIPPTELPVGIFTAMVGVPTFALMMFRKGKVQHGT